ncbi:hypothetical protein SAMN05216207_104646 [Pseudonocardia ammonioxydans]|uniref:Uncharacterized protein n=1 Tax=Pseudonocardia ammonioxydans TaxID=260086 RepID=A0A1I5GGI6_PSUAM|nr:hypothetical protein [Pseudonocardia ammonioxydans]SFO35134.1 hypothetical protein SAMN05216207_104646 [Pseudonocardia ammonioxydans]
MTGPDRIRDAVRDVLHTGPPDRGFPDDRPGECRWCGVSDGDVLALVHASGHDTAQGHGECAEPGYAPTPACTGFPDACGAGPGEPCRDAACPSLAAEPAPAEVGPHLVTYTQPHPDHGTWTSPPLRFPTRTDADDYVAAVTLLAGPGAASRRTWSVRPEGSQ